MTTLRLHLASRRVMTAVCAIVLGALGLQLAIARAGTSTVAGSVILPQLAALLPATVIGVNTHQPFGELERLAARRLAPLRLTHVALLLAVAALTIHKGQLETRNLIGLTGMALLAATTLDAQFSWTVPVSYVAVCVVAATLYSPAAWSWPLLPSTNHTATAIALGLLAAGLLTFTRLGVADHRSGWGSAVSGRARRSG